MSDFRHSTPQPYPEPSNRWHRFLAREVLAVAAQLKASAVRLTLLSESLPLPPPEAVAWIIEKADETLYGYEPGVSFHVDLEVLAHDLTDVAEKLEESAHSNLSQEGSDDE